MDGADGGSSADPNATLEVEDLVDYCHTQAGLLSGHVERMADEADALLEEIDERTAEIRSRLEGAADVEGTETPASATGPGGDTDLAAIEELQDDLEKKQQLAEAKHSRMKAFQQLATNYTELANDLATEADSEREAIRRVVEFEADADAPAYFDEQETLLEMAASDTDDG